VLRALKALLRNNAIGCGLNIVSKNPGILEAYTRLLMAFTDNMRRAAGHILPVSDMLCFFGGLDFPMTLAGF